jgi:hypothetical protein
MIAIFMIIFQTLKPKPRTGCPNSKMRRAAFILLGLAMSAIFLLLLAGIVFFALGLAVHVTQPTATFYIIAAFLEISLLGAAIACFKSAAD